jgi:hypothetical protein
VDPAGNLWMQRFAVEGVPQHGLTIGFFQGVDSDRFPFGGDPIIFAVADSGSMPKFQNREAPVLRCLPREKVKGASKVSTDGNLEYPFCCFGPFSSTSFTGASGLCSGLAGQILRLTTSFCLTPLLRQPHNTDIDAV